jgi:hypothetical protein
MVKTNENVSNQIGVRPVKVAIQAISFCGNRSYCSCFLMIVIGMVKTLSEVL